MYSYKYQKHSLTYTHLHTVPGRLCLCARMCVCVCWCVCVGVCVCFQHNVLVFSTVQNIRSLFLFSSFVSYLSLSLSLSDFPPLSLFKKTLTQSLIFAYNYLFVCVCVSVCLLKQILFCILVSFFNGILSIVGYLMPILFL